MKTINMEILNFDTFLTLNTKEDLEEAKRKIK